jgi:hypothetical protein
MIQTLSFSTKAIEKGVVLTFNAPGNSIVSADQYFYYFDVANIIPKTPEPIISFDPVNASYSMIADKNFSPKIAISVKTTHSSECQILCRLVIKDIYNRILYTDYILVITSPASSVSFNGTLLASNVPSNIGPNGGSIITFDQTSTSLSEISPGMTVTGPGIPSATTVTVRGFTDQASNKVELSTLIQTSTNRTGVYVFTRQTKCVDPSLLAYRETIPNYIVLDKNNNWQYSFNDKTIVEFIRENLNDDSIVIFLPNKNIGLLPTNEEFSNLPQAPIIRLGGRVTGDSIPITELN